MKNQQSCFKDMSLNLFFIIQPLFSVLSPTGGTYGRGCQIGELHSHHSGLGSCEQNHSERDPAGIQGTASVGPLLFGLTCSAPVLINNTYFEFKQRQRGRGFTAILSFKVVKDRNFCFRCYLHMYILVTRSVLLSSWLHDENTDTQV